MSLLFVVPIFQADTNIKLITISTGTRSATFSGSHSIVLNRPLPAAAMIPIIIVSVNTFVRKNCISYQSGRSNCLPILS